MRKSTLVSLLLSILMAASIASVSAQDPTPEPSPGASPRPGIPGMPGGQSQDPQPYEKVITKDAKTKKGIFSVHQVKDKYYYEIPKTEFGKQFLWVTQIARTTLGVGYGGQALTRRVVRWELNESKVLLRNVNYSVVANLEHPIAEAVSAANNDTILMSFRLPHGAPKMHRRSSTWAASSHPTLSN